MTWGFMWRLRNSVFIRKFLAAGIVILFISIAFAPTVAARSSGTTNSSDELVELTVQICEVDEVRNHSILVSKRDIVELEKVFNNLKSALKDVETREEAAAVFNETVIELDKLGLLPDDVSVKEAQRLVTGGYQNLAVMDFFKKMYTKNGELLNNNTNVLCLIAGKTTNTFVWKLYARVTMMMEIIVCIWETLEEKGIPISDYFERLSEMLEDLYNKGYQIVGELIWIPVYIFCFVIFLSIYRSIILNEILPISTHTISTVTFGERYVGWEQPSIYYPACGWVNSVGVNGLKSWNGSFYGQLGELHLPNPGSEDIFKIGMVGFTGIKIDHYFLGFALKVKLGPNPPEF